jgi:hypothetical protein
MPSLEAGSPAALERRSNLERRAHSLSRHSVVAALPVGAIAWLLLSGDSQSLPLGFAALFFALVAGTLLIPGATLILMALVERLCGP